MKNTVKTNGFTLLEVMGAMTLISVAGLMICSSLITSGKSLSRSRQRFDFLERIDASAQQMIHSTSDPFFLGSGEEQEDDIHCLWQIKSENGLLSLRIRGEHPEKKFSSEMLINKSAWLSRLAVIYE